MRVCQISAFMGHRQRRRAYILLIISKINLLLPACPESSASDNINLTHLHGILIYQPDKQFSILFLF